MVFLINPIFTEKNAILLVRIVMIPYNYDVSDKSGRIFSVPVHHARKIDSTFLIGN